MEVYAPEDDGWRYTFADCDGHDVFHEPGWVQAHADGGLPLLVVGRHRDAVAAFPVVFRGPAAASPPGFSGVICGGQRAHQPRALAAAMAMLRELGVVAAYVRQHPTICPDLSWADVDAQLHPLDLPPPVIVNPDGWTAQSMRPGHRRQAEQAAATHELRWFPACGDALDTFHALHEQTMDRLGAKPQYRMGRARMGDVVSKVPSRLLLAYGPEGPAAGAVVLVGDHAVTYWFGATADAYVTGAGPLRKLAPQKAVLAEVLRRAAAEPHRLIPARLVNLTGGMDHGDQLEDFKVGFGGRVVTPHLAWRVIFDRSRFKKLCADAGVPPTPNCHFPPF